MPSGLAHVVQGGYGSFTPTPHLCAPRRGFRSAEGLRSAWPVATGPFGRGPTPLRGTAAQKAGLRYERKVLRLLATNFDGFQASPWFKFEDKAGLPRFCQPDGLWRSPDGTSAAIFEIKIRFSSDAYYQLQRLYAPVVRRAFEEISSLSLVTICRSFDPSIPFPEPIIHLDSLSPDTLPSAAQIGVYTWRL